MNPSRVHDHVGESERIRALAGAEPRWSRVVRARDVWADDGPVLLHAGPPFRTLDEIPIPVMNSFAFACVYEGWAKDLTLAESMVRSGRVALFPAQDVGAVVPLAGVISPSMYLAEVIVKLGVSAHYAPLHEGISHAALFGRRDPDMVEHRRWIDTALADWIAAVLEKPLPLGGILCESLADGDDCHSRTTAGSKRLVDSLVGRAQVGGVPERIESFLGNSPAFALNIWMATAASFMSALDGVPGSTVVTRAGGNGVEFGIQLSGAPGFWTTTPAPIIDGARDSECADSPRLPAIGDSAVIDFLGLGGQTLSTAPAVRAGVENYLPSDAAERPARILHSRLGALGSRLTFTDARKAVEAGYGPMILLGILDASGKLGRIGTGVADIPAQIFRSALAVVTRDAMKVIN